MMALTVGLSVKYLFTVGIFLLMQTDTVNSVNDRPIIGKTY